MSFLNPLFLLGLLAAAIPLLIYLIHLRRPKTIRFSTLTFFDSLKSGALKRLRVKKWLLLALRMAAILMLAFALARPFIPTGLDSAGAEGSPQLIGILIDNSPGMERIDRHGPYIEQAKEAAAEIIRQADSDIRFDLEVTHGPPLGMPSMSRGQAAGQIERLEAVNMGNYLHERLAGLSERLQSHSDGRQKIYLVTGGQGTLFRAVEEHEDPLAEGVELTLVRVGEGSTHNAAVTNLELRDEFLSADEPVTFVAEVKNFGPGTVRNHFLSLEYNNRVAGEHPVELEGGESKEYLFELLPGGERRITGSLRLEGDELTFDNQRWFSLNIPENRRITRIGPDEESRAYPSFIKPVLEAVLESGEPFEMKEAGWESVDWTGSERPDMLLLDEVREIPGFVLDDLIGYLQTGGGVFFLPSEMGDVRTYERFLERTGAGGIDGIEGRYGSFDPIDRLASPRRGHPVLDDMFEIEEDEELRVNLPEIFYRYNLRVSETPGSYRILETENGEAVLFERPVGEGVLLVSGIGSSPGWSNFSVKPLFAPLIYRLVRYLAAGEKGGLSEHQLGERFEYHLDRTPDEVIVELRGERLIPERRPGFQGLMIVDEAQDWLPGIAEIITDDVKFYIAVNQNTMESDLAALEEEQFTTLLSQHADRITVHKIDGERQVEELLATAGRDRELWFWFILAAVGLLIAESIVGRLFKAESIA